MTKQILNWPALNSVPHNIVADSTWNNNIETFTPNQLQRIWPGIDVTKGYYANNPYPYENTIIYNPNDKSVDNNVIALDGLHYMHDNPAYEDLYTDLLNALKENPQAVFEALRDQGLSEEQSRKLTKKFISKEQLESIDKEYLYPAIDGFLRRQFAPDYMRNVPRGYAYPYNANGKLKTSIDNIQKFMESIVLPEVIVTPNKNINYLNLFK